MHRSIQKVYMKSVGIQDAVKDRWGGSIHLAEIDESSQLVATLHFKAIV